MLSDPIDFIPSATLSALAVCLNTSLSIIPILLMAFASPPIPNFCIIPPLDLFFLGIDIKLPLIYLLSPIVDTAFLAKYPAPSSGKFSAWDLLILMPSSIDFIFAGISLNSGYI